MVGKKKTTNKVVSKSQKIDNKDNKILKETTNKNTNTRRKVKYNIRLSFCLLFFIVFYICCALLIGKTFDYQNSKTIKYQDKQNVDYKVYLKKNNFYEQEFLDKDMIYVASLIDTIDIDFTYDFLVEENVNIDFDYKIVGNLVISSPTDNNKQYFNKKYVLLDKATKSIKDSNRAEIKENIKIDYDYYNNLASSFKSQFIVDTDSYLNVYLEIDKKSNSESDIQINENIGNSFIEIEVIFETYETIGTEEKII